MAVIGVRLRWTAFRNAVAGSMGAAPSDCGSDGELSTWFERGLKRLDFDNQGGGRGFDFALNDFVHWFDSGLIWV